MRPLHVTFFLAIAGVGLSPLVRLKYVIMVRTSKDPKHQKTEETTKRTDNATSAPLSSHTATNSEKQTLFQSDKNVSKMATNAVTKPNQGSKLRGVRESAAPRFSDGLLNLAYQRVRLTPNIKDFSTSAAPLKILTGVFGTKIGRQRHLSHELIYL